MRLRPASAVRLAAASIGAPARASQPGHARIAASGRPAGGRAASIRALLASARGRACARLERALRFRIAVVCVPDGYARSTVVREFLHQRGGAYRRIEIDPSDDGLLGFLRALAAAVGDAVPALSSSFVSIYDRLADAPDAAEQFAGWAGQYLTSIEATIVVDGLAGSTDERVAALLAALIDRTPDTLRWLVVAASGERLPIPRWLAEGQMDLPIDAADFALTAADLLRTSAPAAERFRPERLQQLCALTEGWPAAIALGMAAWNAIDLAAVPRERPALYAYLAAAAVSTLTPRARTFIDATCLFRNFDAALLECAGVFEADEIIVELRDDLGVLALDDAGSYTYEPLFRDFSIARLRGRSDGAFQRVAAASATAYERDGRFAQAIAVHLELGERDAASVLLGAHGFALMECGESNVVARALREIPHDVLLAHPRALAVKASFESLHGKFDIAEAWFRHALDRITDGVPRCDIVYRFATDLVRRERSDAIELLEPVVSAMNQEAPLAAPLWALLATAYATNRRLADAARAIERALRIVSQVKDRGTRAKIVYQAGFVAFALRDIETAKTLSLQAHREASAAYSYDVAARALSVLYNIAVDYEDDVGASRTYLEALAELSVRTGSRQLLLYATLCRYEIEVLAGNVAQIALLDERLRSLEVFFSVLTTETLLPAQALQATWSGDFQRAYYLLEPSVEHQVNPDRQAYRYAEISVYAAAAGLRAEASAAAERALAIVRQMRSIDKTVLQTRALVALTFVLVRRRARAAKLLVELARESAENERIGLFIDVVQTLAARWVSGTSPPALAAQLDVLEARDFGGLARMLEALPLPELGRVR